MNYKSQFVCGDQRGNGSDLEQALNDALAKIEGTKVEVTAITPVIQDGDTVGVLLTTLLREKVSFRGPGSRESGM